MKKKHSIGKKTLLMVLPAIFVSLALIAFVGYQTANSIINNEIKVKMDNQLNYVTSQINNTLTSHGRVALSLAKSVEAVGATMTEQQYIDLLKGSVGMNADTLGGGVWFEPYKHKSDVQYFGPYIYRDGSDLVYTKDYETTEYDYPHWDWYKIGKNATTPIVWSSAYYDDVSKKTMVTTTAPFYDANKQFLGVTTADIDLTSVQTMINSIKAGATGRAILIDSTGQYLSDADQAKVMNKKITEDTNQSLAALAKDLLAGNRSQGSYTDKNGTYDVYSAKIPETGWMLAIIMPQKELYAPLYDLLTKLLIIAVVVLAGLSLLVFLAIRLVSEPIKFLTALLQNAGRGNFTGTVPAKYVRRHDEIGLLIASYQKMADNINEQVVAAERISHGDLDIQLTPKSSEDKLSNSMIEVVTIVERLTTEINALSVAAIGGDLTHRGDAGKFAGQYATLITGINGLLDEMEKPLKSLKLSARSAEQQAQYQKNEVSRLLEALQRLSEGDLSARYDASPADAETAALYEVLNRIGNYFNSTVETLRSYISEISDVLSAMAEGDLDVTIRSEYKGDFIALKDSINAIVDSLNGVFQDIDSAAGQVAAGTTQVSGGAQALSQGATEQASAIEQLTASIEQIATQTKQSAASANQASGLSAEARDNALKGNRHMQEMLKSMREINEASTNISKIIKVIDDIAFQTNLLALNAAVEAARAGQYGKGFAVVAEEVRSLAARSANAAKDTTALIESTVRKAETGMSIADDTAAALKDIVNGVEKTTDLVTGIASASNEQATAVAQISRGIEQVAQVVQTTSATAEQSAATSEELSGQAENLKSMVARFRLKGGLQQVAQKRIIKTEKPTSLSRTAKPVISLGDREFGKY